MKGQIKAWMKADIQTLTEDSSLMEAINLTRKHQIRHIPIVDGNGALVGIVTDRDIKKYTPSILTERDATEFQRVLEETEVGKIMTREPLTVAPTASLMEVVEVFFQKKIGALPVVLKGKLVGIITKTDMLRAFHQGLVGAGKKSKPAAR